MSQRRGNASCVTRRSPLIALEPRSGVTSRTKATSMAMPSEQLQTPESPCSRCRASRWALLALAGYPEGLLLIACDAIIDSMSQLIVRNIPEEVVRCLKQRAASHGHSAEEEHREILKRALLAPASSSLKAMLQAIPNVGLDADFKRPRRSGRSVRL